MVTAPPMPSGVALDDAGMEPEGIDLINAHGTGTDAQRSRGVERLPPGVRRVVQREIPVTCSKALFGHLLGAAGALEAVVCVLCLQEGEAHPVPGEAALDPAMSPDLVLSTPRALSAAPF